MRKLLAGILATLLGVVPPACIITTGSDGDGGGGEGGEGGEGGDGGSADCAEEGTGTLTIEIAGLPSDADVSIDIDGPGYVGDVNDEESLEVAGGSYAITPGATAYDGGDLVRLLYAADSDTVCVVDDETTVAEIDYDDVATSHKLWAAGGDDLLGLSADSLDESGTASAALSPTVGTIGGIAFDDQGGVWVTFDGTTLAYFSASTLGSSASPTADIAIASDELSASASSVAIDGDGDLWVVVAYPPAVLGFDGDDLTASGAPGPAVELTGLAEPRAIAFDEDGDLWVTDVSEDLVAGYDAASLLSSTSAPDREIFCQSDLSVVHTMPDGLAFDDGGDLWVHYLGGELVRITSSDQDVTGTHVITPGVQLTLETATVAPGLAFDEAGGLWLAYGGGQLARLSSSQLVSSDDPVVPYRIVDSASIDAGAPLALFPAPAGLPLAAAWP